MNGKRPKIQNSLALKPLAGSEPPVSGYEGAEPVMAKPAPESPAFAEQIMEEVCCRENLERAWKRVRRNKGGPRPSIRSQLLDGTYKPQPQPRISGMIPSKARRDDLRTSQSRKTRCN